MSVAAALVQSLKEASLRVHAELARAPPTLWKGALKGLPSTLLSSMDVPSLKAVSPALAVLANAKRQEDFGIDAAEIVGSLLRGDPSFDEEFRKRVDQPDVLDAGFEALSNHKSFP